MMSAATDAKKMKQLMPRISQLDPLSLISLRLFSSSSRSADVVDRDDDVVRRTFCSVELSIVVVVAVSVVRNDEASVLANTSDVVVFVVVMRSF